jgi:hypothetical protein
VTRRIPLGPVIARRTLVDARSGARIVVSIGTPVFLGDGKDWACPYRINGLRKPVSGHAHGIDGIQALQLVSLDVRAALEQTRREFLWLDQAHWQSGFPRMITGLGVPAFERHLEEVMDREYRRFPADLKAWHKRAKSQDSPWRTDRRKSKP